MPKLRQLLWIEYRNAQKEQPPRKTEYDPERPWNSVWKKALVADDWYWRTQFEEPALLVRAGVDDIATHLDNDAEIGTQELHQTIPQIPKEQLDQARDKIRRGRANRQSKSSAARGGNANQSASQWGRVERKDAQGFFTHNRWDVKLCDGFNLGTCNHVDHRTNLCSTGSGEAHQCKQCLQNTHGYCDHGKPKGKGKKNNKNKGKSQGKGGKWREW